jgi:hypothetical protein
MSIVKWKTYCTTESEFITGYLDDTIIPSVCFNNNTHSLDTACNEIIERIYTNHTREIIYWKIFCDTEDMYTYGYLDHLTPPTQCFNNHEHIISHHPIPLHNIYNNNRRTQEESGDTGGHFQSVCYKMVCPVGESSHDYSFLFPVSALCIIIQTTADHTDDDLEVVIGPDTIIGNITSNVVSSDTVINVSSTVLAHIKVGFYVDLFDGTNTDPLGRVTAIDASASTITVETAATQSFSAATPTYIRMTVKCVSHFKFGFPGRYEVGKDKIGGSYVPTGTIIRVNYTNNGVASSDFYAMIEILY